MLLEIGYLLIIAGAVMLGISLIGNSQTQKQLQKPPRPITYQPPKLWPAILLVAGSAVFASGSLMVTASFL